MASTLLLALSASAALIAGPALACEGQGCWGMAPAQELNPGYTGPDYSQFAPPPQDGVGPGPGAYQDGGPGPQGYGPGPEAYQDGGPGPQGYGPTNDQPHARAFQSAQGYGPGAPDYGPPPPAYDDDQDEGPGPDADGYGPPQNYGPPTAYGSQGAYGPPRDYSPAEGDLGAPEGEPPSAYGMARPAPAYGADRYSYAAPDHHGWRRHDAGPMGPGPDAGEAPPAPYQAYNSDGYEQFSETPPDADYQSHSYRAGSVAQYDYDSGWVEDTGRSSGWTTHPPLSNSSPYGPPPCDRCTVEH